MFRVGLTGNVASGKSAVADVWRRLGAAIVDADELARDAVRPGSEGLRRVVQRFGNRVLHEDGSLDRAALRNVVFADAGQRLALERILHPEIARLRKEEEARLEQEGVHVVVHMIPLLFEAGLTKEVNTIVLVDAPAHMRLRRIQETRGLNEEEARRMIDAQMTSDEKRASADIVIDNDGTLEQLEARAADAWRQVLRQAG
ncbi:MAG: dephospho-CoA kinase [Longimicrobiales bacterium]